ncbi:M23 family metallopeptidase [Winogradskyella sp.]|uniref:M23 family metallopeptidase n=1 Tax=Winogradskyella sp. TaxID=1883156 RepID=UPI00260713F1|nr:M23 family metallopeptidase [Winogradskyella sp.]
MTKVFKYLFFTIVITSCENNKEVNIENISSSEEHVALESNIEIDKKEIDYKSLFTDNPQYIAKDFDFPVIKPNAMGMGYFNKQKLGSNRHLIDGSNGFGEESIYMDKPVYAIGNGYISEAKAYVSKWGNVIRIVHLLDGNLYESLYAHCNTMLVKPNQFIKKGEQIGTIITCNKLYHTHLHFEIRDSLDLEIGSGYTNDTARYLEPTDFIRKNRN